jgi:hypothetical protein
METTVTSPSRYHTCQTRGVEYPSFRRYTLEDPCYVARQAARFDVDDAFGTEDQTDGIQGKHYGKTTVEQVDAEPRPRGPGRTSNQYGTFDNHTPSDKQVAFIKRLCAERGLEVDPTWIRTKSRCSAEIDRLIKIPATVVPADVPRASEKQQAFLRSLLAERDLVTDETEAMLAAISKTQASAMIEQIKATPRVVNNHKADGTRATTIAEDGFYVLEHGDHVDVYKVQRAVHGSGNLYAKRLVPGVDGAKGTWEYEGRAPLSLPLERLTLERAKELGRLYGMCVKCGATLTDERSIEAGIGPICGSRGW